MTNVGLVLSGGMAKGAYQIGALRAISEMFGPADISCVSSASVGVLNSYLYLTGALDKGINLWNSICATNTRPWVTTLLRSTFLQNAIKSLISEERITNVFYIPLLNLRTRTLSYIDIKKVPPEDIGDYLRASVAMPIYNSAVQINGEPFYDGALIDNIPIYPILKHPLDYVICIYFDSCDYIFENDYLNNKIIKLSISDNKFVSNSVVFKHEYIKRMIDDGYAKAKRILEYVFVNGTDNVDSVYSRIADLNAMNHSHTLRITGDVAVNNMNRLTKKLMKKSEIR
ncbi:MAG: patatin-like phospholipase family protein [Oscillospiraceae bacterium]|jgi:predicted acylesterase/phospholipase RssA|nr:patatin-like phospholipase family protein [Oscillospiraceae bacterium]